MKITTVKNARTDRKLLTGWCALIALMGGSSLWWLYSKQSVMDAEAADITNKLQNSSTIDHELAEANRRLKAAEGQLRYLEQAVSAKSYVPTLLKQLQLVGRQNKLSVESVRPVVNVAAAADKNASSKNAEAQLYDLQDIQIAVNGRFWDCMQFVDGLTRFPKILAVRRIDIKPKARQFKTDPYVVDMSISLTAFIQKDKAAVK